MKKLMEAKSVTKFILFFILCNTTSLIFSQKTKYLLFDETKDSIISLNYKKYFKIDKNLFNIDRYNESDYISAEVFNNIKFTDTKELWENGKKTFLQFSKEKNIIIETKNEIFEYICH
ncbi:MAG: hypothetical protein ABF250_07345 [Polaribacter sp.]|uniref:hypothetical protein n=1 Tax=Polaribacter sp. TaxID=1920175 RepID=UPI00321B9ADC